MSDDLVFEKETKKKKEERTLKSKPFSDTMNTSKKAME